MRSYLKGLRFAAFLIDALISTIFILLFSNITSAIFLKIFPDLPIPIYLTWAFFIIIGIAYILLKDGFNGKSLGKRIMGLIVIQENKKPCSFKLSFIRNLILFIPFINLYEIYLFLKNHQRPRLGEKITNTRIEET
ncbi:MAG: RDD family protein [Thermoanaerobaculia bacterium]